MLWWLEAMAALFSLAAMAYLSLAFWTMGRWHPLLPERDAGAPEEAVCDWPGISVLKPLYGDGDYLYPALRSFCKQDYPIFEIVFGVQRPTDPAIAVVQRLQAEFPDLSLRWVCTETRIGSNPKVNNLAGILAACHYDSLVISDADITVGPHYLRRICAPLQNREVGVVTCLYRACPVATFWSRVLASQVNSLFLPSVLVAARLGPNIFCGGATMALRRATLEAFGGLPRLANQLADDYWLGAYSRELGQRTWLVNYVVDTVVQETGFRVFYQHALRWSRTTRAVQPLGYSFSFLSYPLPLVLVLSPWMGFWGGLPLGVVLVLRLVYHKRVEHKLSAESSFGVALLGDFLGLWIWFHALFVRHVAWRGSQFAIDADGRMDGHDGAT
ncbi:MULTISPECIES: bacteriohopanetetrol glucosamine biosynthesis glycosyltransferase HpnI [Acidithiobacillus]|uniref:Glycosyl transferase n=2 Tax=Acidithiobacillus TaxID=119977 RepID=A0A179B938_ACIFR|nr:MULTISPECIES: bacteriohopanetetrol glucosamine biosynthesis glycosyltransferase HpnI [Acidithiobacillus]MDA8182525.1 bacteriohopanetetrol glucosamine biosynthesis glycosyltransferase HpnI [Acidithiobacillus sp.]MBU2854775.1 glycosyltransferase [Acidithiobacillus ferriphilus]MEB8486644.1 bacteriohopanetetrol glucosamine biosynthesis glycosyltransferase HpnI [Acidithiobacillus ferriphilus]MEB8490619.1 bacteriohopanetetrol glucosamine biosynthesis glycosyltransferase HpnI [Acidithiobacillus fer